MFPDGEQSGAFESKPVRGFLLPCAHLQMRDDFTIADRLSSGMAEFTMFVKQATDFFDQAGFEHGANALLDSLVKDVTLVSNRKHTALLGGSRVIELHLPVTDRFPG